jgi:hypothetical protein
MPSTRTAPDTVTCPPWCIDTHPDGDPYMLDEHISGELGEIPLSLARGVWRRCRASNSPCHGTRQRLPIGAA